MAPPSAASMPPASASADQKLDFLMAKICEMTSLMVINQEKVAKLETRADAAEAAISSLRDELLSVKTRMGGDIVNLQSELISVKTTLNARDQQTRYRSIKLSGLPISEEEAGTSAADLPKLLSKKVYEKILSPILAAAKDKKEIDAIPTMAKCIDEIYRTKSWSNSKPSTIPGAPSEPPAPPTIIIKLFSPAIRLAILRNKKGNIPSPTPAEKNAGSAGFFISEDLTPLTFKLLRDLQRQQSVDKAWTVDGRIRYIRTGDPDRKVHKVKSIFDSTTDILRRT
jgi:hypothetical protein